MSIPWWSLLIVYALGALTALGGVALGGWFVFRTKREPYESLFTKQPEGDAFNLEDEQSIADTFMGPAPGLEPETGKSGLHIPSITEELNKQAMSQMEGKV